MNPFRKCKRCDIHFEYFNAYDLYCSRECDFLDRFTPGLEVDCWTWKGRLDFHGYGQFSSNVSAHRFSYEYYKEPIPQGLLVRHICNNRPCVNPNHLRVGTHKDNMADAVIACSHKGERNGAAILTNQQVLEIYSSRKDTSVLANQFDVSEGAICDIKYGRTWLHITNATPYNGIPNYNAKKGANHHNAKLDEQEVTEIYKSIERNKDLAKKYGVRPATICDIKHGRIWNHLTKHHI